MVKQQRLGTLASCEGSGLSTARCQHCLWIHSKRPTCCQAMCSISHSGGSGMITGSRSNTHTPNNLPCAAADAACTWVQQQQQRRPALRVATLGRGGG